MKKILALLLTAAVLLSLAACNKGGQGAGTPSEGGGLIEGEDYTTGDASLDDPRNQDGIGEKELLVISFGTSYNDNRRMSIGSIEEAMEKAFPEYSVRRAFTSQIIIDRVQSRDGVAIDNVKQALDRAVANGVKTLVVQPTHLMNGIEYEELMAEIAGYGDSFEKLSVGKPLLTDDEDFDRVMKAMADSTAAYNDGKTAICFMGHGTHAPSNSVYSKLQNSFAENGYADYYVGTVEAAPTIEDIMTAMEGKNYERVLLQPLMIVAGDHANNDMAGDEDDSWKNILSAKGYKVETVLTGMGEIEAIRQILVEHAQSAIEALK